MRKFSSRPIRNEVLTINSEYMSPEYHLESKLQAKIFEKKEGELIEFEEEHHDKTRNFSSVPIQKEALTITLFSQRKRYFLIVILI